jgi:16S rRNA (guanine(966)-N(2))-methyltransferase RsmD
MRVIAGIAKGHKLQAPEGMDTRPTTDRIKETLFNILSPDLMDCTFLDLFSGTGGIGIEALSRGARKVVFVDSSLESRKIIDYNLAHTKLVSKAEVYTKKVLDVIMSLGEKNEKFDIIFMDPPYKKGFVEETLKAIKEANLLNQEGYIVIEHETQGDWDNIEGFNIIKQKVYKKTTMTFVEVL